MRKPYLGVVLLLFLLADTGYSFVQHLNVSLDGDMAAITLPAPWYTQVLQDPFGLAVLLKNEVYPAPNRFFAHQLFSSYFKSVPLALQAVVSPLQSVYAASAILKTLVQLFLVVVLAMYSSPRSLAGRPRQLLLAIALLLPLFQASGYNGQMGIIDKSVTYTMFYAFPMGLLLLYLLPFYRAAYVGEPVKLGLLGNAALVALAVVLAFNGPLVPAVVLILCPVALLLELGRAWQPQVSLSFFGRLWQAILRLPRQQLVHFVLLSGLCLFSLYIGRNNSENQAGIPLLERYARLPLGLYYQLTGKLGIPLLLVLLGVNTFLIRRQAPSAERTRLLAIGKWLALFALGYLLLLPLGGYRDYRPNIIRRDTFLPVLLGLLYFYGLTSYYLLQASSGRLQRRYALGLAAFGLFFTLADKPIRADNACEKAALQQIADSPGPVVRLEHSDCFVMGWYRVERPEDSDVRAQMLRYWGVTKEKKLYFQP